MIGRQPPVDDFGNLDLAAPCDSEPSRRFFATIAGVALDRNNRKCRSVFGHGSVRFISMGDASVLVWAAVVGREPHAMVDVAVKGVEA